MIPYTSLRPGELFALGCGHGFDRADLLNTMASPATGVGIHVQYLFYRFRHVGGCFTNYPLYCSRDVFEPNTTFEERGHCYFIGRIESNRLATSCFDSFIGQT